MKAGTQTPQDRCSLRQQSEIFFGGRGGLIGGGGLMPLSLFLFLSLSPLISLSLSLFLSLPPSLPLSLSPSTHTQVGGDSQPLSECTVLLSNGRDPRDRGEVQGLGKGHSLCPQHVLQSKGVSDDTCDVRELVIFCVCECNVA